MAKVILTSGEFLSLFPGIVQGDDTNVIETALIKVFGINPYVYCKTSKEAKALVAKLKFEFSDYVHNNHDDLVRSVMAQGGFMPEYESYEEYIKNFEEYIGCKIIVVDRIPINTQIIEQEMVK